MTDPLFENWALGFSERVLREVLASDIRDREGLKAWNGRQVSIFVNLGEHYGFDLTMNHMDLWMRFAKWFAEFAKKHNRMATGQDAERNKAQWLVQA